MNRSFCCRVLVVVLLCGWGSLCAGAVFQEPIAGDPDTYRTRHLYSESGRLPIDATYAPEESQELEAPFPDSGVQSVQKSTPKITARYERVTIDLARQIIAKYKSIPGGITLESAASGLGRIRNVLYDPSTNVFMVNGNTLYENPVSRLEMKELLKALGNDDRLGVSLGDRDLIYGDLREGSLPCIQLKLADHYLGCIVFANNRWVHRHRFPEGYRPKPNRTSGGFYAVYFNFSDYRFLTENGRITPGGSDLTITLVPLTGEKDAQGGYLPDYEKIQSEKLSREYEENIGHIVRHMAHYQEEGRVRRVNTFGEAAAFVRALRDSQIDLPRLIASME